jgi:hypothetical protein
LLEVVEVAQPLVLVVVLGVIVVLLRASPLVVAHPQKQN